MSRKPQRLRRLVGPVNETDNGRHLRRSLGSCRKKTDARRRRDEGRCERGTAYLAGPDHPAGDHEAPTSMSQTTMEAINGDTIVSIGGHVLFVLYQEKKCPEQVNKVKP